MQNCCAVIAAAGSSSRMGKGVSKQFIPLLGIPVIIRTLMAFDAAETVSASVVVCRAGDEGRLQQYIDWYAIKKVAAVVAGGATRQESAAAGAMAVPEGFGLIAVHDGARPLITPEKINLCVNACLKTGAAALGVPLKDTVKKVDGSGFVVSTPDRSGMVAVQTPQVFRYGLYMKALRDAFAAGENYTDDCQLAEKAGVKVSVCSGDYGNIKITTPEDVCIAEAILRMRGIK